MKFFIILTTPIRFLLFLLVYGVMLVVAPAEKEPALGWNYVKTGKL